MVINVSKSNVKFNLGNWYIFTAILTRIVHYLFQNSSKTCQYRGVYNSVKKGGGRGGGAGSTFTYIYIYAQLFWQYLDSLRSVSKCLWKLVISPGS